MDPLGGDFEGADVVGGRFVDSGAEEKVAVGGYGDRLVNGDAGGLDGEHVVGGEVHAVGGGDGVRSEAVIAIDDSDELEIVVVEAHGGADEVDVQRIDPIVDAEIAIGSVAKGWGEEVVARKVVVRFC